MALYIFYIHISERMFNIILDLGSPVLFASVLDFIIKILCTLTDQYDTFHVSAFILGLRNIHSTLDFKYAYAVLKLSYASVSKFIPGTLYIN